MNSSQLKSYLTGLILGDGYIDKGTQKRSFKICIINKEWAEKIYFDLKSCTNFNIYFKEHPPLIDKNNVSHKTSYEVKIMAHPYFAKIYHNFYNDYRKRRIVTNSLSSLDWQGWANWYMSDGYLVRVGKESGVIRDRRVQICTDRYLFEDIQKIQNILSKKYEIETNIIKRNASFRLNIRLNSAQKFFCNIYPFVVPSFYYKLDMCFDYRPSWMNDEYYALMQNISSARPLIKQSDEIV